MLRSNKIIIITPLFWSGVQRGRTLIVCIFTNKCREWPNCRISFEEKYFIKFSRIVSSLSILLYWRYVKFRINNARQLPANRKEMTKTWKTEYGINEKLTRNWIFKESFLQICKSTFYNKLYYIWEKIQLNRWNILFFKLQPIRHQPKCRHPQTIITIRHNDTILLLLCTRGGV